MADPSGSHADPTNATQAAASYANPTAAAAAVSRGRFLSGVTLGLGGLIGAAVTVPVVGLVFGPSFGGEPWYWVNVGPLSQFPVDPKNYITVLFERVPDGGVLDRRVAFVRQYPAGQFTVISNTCMHLGCPVRSNPGGFSCPCHGGVYNTEGERTGGPPPRPLNRYEHKIANDHLYLGRAFASEVINGKVVMTDTWKDPAQPIQGLLSFLYPPAPR